MSHDVSALDQKQDFFYLPHETDAEYHYEDPGELIKRANSLRA